MKIFAGRANSWTADVPLRSSWALRGVWEQNTPSHQPKPQRSGADAPRDGCGFPTDAAETAYHSVELHRLLAAREKENP